MAILKPTQPTHAELMAQIEALKAANAKLREAKQRSLSLKVSTKGGVSLYGLGRFPVTLYASQWKRLLGVTQDIEAFLADNASALSSKDDE